MRNSLCWACGLAMVMAGCGGSSGGAAGSTDRVALEEVAEVYRIYILTNRKPPAKFEDLARMKTIGPMGIGALGTGDVIVRYGAMMTDTEDGPAKTSSNEILAYEKKVPESGGQVLMLDRTISRMTPEEFKAAKKAGKD